MTVNRIYYYDINGTQEPDHEYMAAFLLDEGVIFLSPHNTGSTIMWININDYFCPASDCEELLYNDIPILFDLYVKKQYDGVCEFVARKRGIENKHWRDK